MSSKRTVGLQLTPRLLPVSFAAVDVVGSGSPPPLAFRMGGAPKKVNTADFAFIEEGYAIEMRPRCTLLLMDATTPGALALRDGDLEALTEAYEKDAGVAEQLSRAAAIRHFETDRASYLMAIIMADGSTTYVAPLMKAPDAKKIPSFKGEIHPDARFWTIGLPAPIEVYMSPDARPREIPMSDLLADAPFIGNSAIDSDGVRALPVVDPLLILSGATDRFNDSCDKYLLHVGAFTNERSRTKLGSLAFYKNKVADTLQHVPSELFKDSEAQLALTNAKTFSKAYSGDAPNSNTPGHEGLKQLLEQREEAAHGLIAWLESESLALIPPLYRTGKDAPTKAAEEGYLAYFNAVLLAHIRLTESERGKIYLLGKLDGRTPLRPTHPWSLVQEFVLAASPPPDSTAKLARKASKGIIGLWLKLVPLILERVAKQAGSYEVSGAVYRTVEEAIRKLTDQIAYLFTRPGSNSSLFDFVDRGRTALQFKTREALAEIQVKQLQITISKDGLEGALDDSKDAAKQLERVIELINASIAFASCWEAIHESKYDLKHLGSGFDLLKSVTYVSKEGVSLALRKATIEAARQEALKKLSARLNLAGTIIDLASTGVKAWDAYRGGDKDAASAELVAGGTGALGSVMLAMSGPVGWSLLALSLGVALYGSTLKDLPFDKLAKFSPFGPAGIRRSSSMANSDKAWTMADSYRDWDPNTSEGLETWIAAATQLAYSFIVQGFTPDGPGLPQHGHVRITVQQPLLPASRLHLRIKATYANQDPRVGTKPVTIDANCWLISLLGTPTLVDYSGKYIMADAVKVVGQQIIELSLRQVQPLMAKDSGGTLKPMDLHSLEVEVRLDVHGDGDPLKFGEDATLIVPTTKGGKKWVRADVLTALKPGPEARSFDASNHA